MNGSTRVFIATAAAVIISTTSCRQEQSAETTKTTVTTKTARPANVRTAVVAETMFAPSIETTGTVAFNQNRSTQVLAPISGPVSRIYADLGAQVSAGTPLALVSSPDFAAAVSALRKAEAAARNARRIADLDEQLFKNDAISRRDLEQAQTDASSADADRDSAIQQLRSLGVSDATIADVRENRRVENLGGVIRAPLSGTVVERSITPGQLLQAGTTPCFTIADLSTVWVNANVFEADLPAVHVGDAAEVITGGGQTISGRVDFVAALVDPTTRAVSVRVVVPNPGQALKRDMYVRVVIHSHVQTTGILVPVSAILRDDENLPYAFVARPDGSFERRHVTIGAKVADTQQIKSGLTPGESIVVDGALFLQSEAHP